MKCKALFALSFLGLLYIAGCGGGSTTPASPTITSVSVSCTPTSVQTGQTSQCSATVTGTGSYSSAVAWSAVSGTISSSGSYIAPATVPTSGSDTITAKSTQDSTKSGTSSITVTAVPVTVTSVSVIASPNTITTAQTSTCAATVLGTGAFSSAVTWTATGGTITSAGVFTPSGVGNAKCIANSAQAGYTGVSGSATITVNAAPLPDITSVTPNTIYADAEIAFQSVRIDGSNFATGQTLDFNIPVSATESSMTSTQLGVTLSLDTPHFSPGFITMDVCENANGTDCGTSGTLALLGAQNYLATSTSGELYFLDQAQGAATGQNGYVRKYKADGTAESSCKIGALQNSLAVDDKTNLFVVDGVAFDATAQNDGSGNCGRSTAPFVQGLPSGNVMATAAESGYTCFTQPSTNSAYCFDLTGGIAEVPFVTASNLGIWPEEIAMGLFGGETDAFVVSLNGTPSLYKVRASDAYTGEEPALALTGITPLSTVQAANPVAGGWQIVVFDSGPASGTIAVLSTYDKLLLLINESTWQITKSVTLSGTPFRIVADTTNGKVIVAYANPTSVTTTYAAVDASSGTVTPLTSTSSLLSVGLAVSADGTKIYSSQRNQMDVKPNQ